MCWSSGIDRLSRSLRDVLTITERLGEAKTSLRRPDRSADPPLQFDSSPTSSYAEVTEVQLTPDVQAKLDQLSGETGRAQDEFVRDALAGYFDELAQVRGMLDSRYDDLRSGRVALIAGEEVMAHFQDKSAARRS